MQPGVAKWYYEQGLGWVTAIIASSKKRILIPPDQAALHNTLLGEAKTVLNFCVYQALLACTYLAEVLAILTQPENVCG